MGKLFGTDLSLIHIWGKTKEKTQKMIEIPACVWYNPTIHIGGAMLRPMTAY